MGKIKSNKFISKRVRVLNEEDFEKQLVQAIKEGTEKNNRVRAKHEGRFGKHGRKPNDTSWK